MKILICGVGALGSHVAAFLAADLQGKHEISVLDFDKVSKRNIEVYTQFYTRDQVGEFKVDALEFNVYKQFGKQMSILHGELTEQNVHILTNYNLVIDCFDNYESRKLLQLQRRLRLVRPEFELLHIGFSDQFTFAIEWHDTYQVPTDITSGMDICEMQGAASFVRMVAGFGSLVAQEFLRNNKKIELIGNRFTSKIL